ncbi:MAG: hypothetical protein ACR2HI_11075 [Gaiella sp.]
MSIRFCDDRGPHGFSWVVDEPATRTSHALAADGRVWLVDPVRHEPALEWAHGLGQPVAVLQLLDRHNRDCAAVAEELGVPHLVTPDALPGTPFETRTLRDAARWRETALWWGAERTLVVAEALGANPFFRSGRDAIGVHPLLRLRPPREALEGLEPEHLLVGHGEGLHGADTPDAMRAALAHSKTGLARIVARIPALVLDARRRRR